MMGPASAARIEDLMAETPCLGSVPRKAALDFVALGHSREYPAGTILFQQGDEAPDVYFLHEGRVLISTLSATGQRQIHTTLEPPEFFGELGVLGAMYRTAGAETLTQSRIWRAPGAAFLDFVAAQPSFALSLLRATARLFAEHEGMIDDLMFLDLKGRVAKRLLSLVGTEDGPPSDGAVLPRSLTHAELAQMVGGSREHVSRTLSAFRRRGLVATRNRRLVLVDVASLRRLAGL